MQAVGLIICYHYFWTNKVFVSLHPNLNLVLTVIICLMLGGLSHNIVEKLIKKIKLK